MLEQTDFLEVGPEGLGCLSLSGGGVGAQAKAPELGPPEFALDDSVGVGPSTA